ncbi:type II toxin-antitoxin system Phd/YefM family antitoxin [Ottowia sp.]|uniref:type II toxin-antitoxin system Phd/YefM family antitoxin n=1 Tax=Ottowia sp. TaxID=1898956 RepID=UPI002C7D5034|nr:type II toxin-antitoxin system prevent-host-death family antitoxin [Ottowia sp.]
MKSISAAEANRRFSALLRDVAAGQTITVLSRGKPVATIAQPRALAAERAAAKKRLLARLEQQAPTGERDWTRGELYES